MRRCQRRRSWIVVVKEKRGKLVRRQGKTTALLESSEVSSSASQAKNCRVLTRYSYISNYYMSISIDLLPCKVTFAVVHENVPLHVLAPLLITFTVTGFTRATLPQEGIACESPKSIQPDPKAKLQLGCKDKDPPMWSWEMDMWPQERNTWCITWSLPALVTCDPTCDHIRLRDPTCNHIRPRDLTRFGCATHLLIDMWKTVGINQRSIRSQGIPHSLSPMDTGTSNALIGLRA